MPKVTFTPTHVVDHNSAQTRDAATGNWRAPNDADLARLTDGNQSVTVLGLAQYPLNYGYIRLNYPTYTPPVGAAIDAIGYQGTPGNYFPGISWTKVRVISQSDPTKEVTTYADGTTGATGPLAVNPKTGSNDLRTFLNDMQVVLETYDPTGAPWGSPGAFLASWAEFGFGAWQYSRPTLTVTAPSPVAGSTIVNTAKPTITWTFTADPPYTSPFGLPQNGYRVRVFESGTANANQYGHGSFNPQTSTPIYDSGDVVSASTSHKLTANLANSKTYRAYVWAWSKLPISGFLHTTYEGTTVAALGQAAYSQFTLNLTPPVAPTLTAPVDGATVSTDIPQLGMTLAAHPVGALQRGVWQVATNSGFTLNTRTFTEPVADQRYSGTTYEDVPAGAYELFQATWYMQGAALDENGMQGPWSTATSFVVSHPPSTLTYYPAGQQNYPGNAVTLTWQFSDPSPTDTQTAYQVIIERDSDGAVVVDSGKIASAGAQFNYTIPAGYMDILLRWRVRVWDSDDVAGPYSANQQFFPRTLPVLAITYPTNGGTINAPAPLITWTVTEPAGSGRVQTLYTLTITRVDTGEIVYQSGNQLTSVTQHQVATPVLEYNKNYTIALAITDSTGIQVIGTVTALASWTPPPAPTVTIDATEYDTDGFVSIEWPQNRVANFIEYALYRRVQGANEWTLVDTFSDLDADYHYFDYTAPANVPVDYAVIQTATVYGVVLSSALTANTVTPVGTHYWIVCEDDTSLSTRLSNVTEDSFADEWEQETINLLGRGRRVERGTHYGRSGSLTAQVYDQADITARQQRINLETMKSSAVVVFLRTPFGDLWQVVLGDFEIDRMAGVGTNEYVELTVPYVEVA